MSKDMTFGEWNKMIDSLFENKSLSAMTYKHLSMDLIAKITGGSPYGLKLDQVIALCGKSNLLKINYEYESEYDFYTKFAKQNLSLRAEPKEVYFALYSKVIDEIKTISTRIKLLIEQRDRIAGSSPSLDNIEDYTQCHPLVSYFIEKNKKALEDRKEYLIHGIVPHAISRSRDWNFGIGSSDVFALMPFMDWFLELNSFSILAHRYAYLDVPGARVVCQAYDDFIGGRSDVYRQMLRKYIDDTKILSKIKKSSLSHHVLCEKIELISRSVSLYKNGDNLLLAVIIPTLVEGLLNGVCIMYNEDIGSLYKHGLATKIEIINSRHSNTIDNFIHSLDYFRYLFPMLRNHIAHGWIGNLKNIDVLAGHLILDLYAVCELVKNANYPMNVLTNRINALAKKQIISFEYKDLIELLAQVKIEICGSHYPAIYKLEYKRDKILGYFFSKTIANKIIQFSSGSETKFNEMIRLLSELSRAAKHNSAKGYFDLANKIKKRLIKERHKQIDINAERRRKIREMFGAKDDEIDI